MSSVSLKGLELRTLHLLQENVTDGDEVQSVETFIRENFFFIVIFIMIGVILALLIQFTLSIIVYNHATNNNDPNALLWAIVVFFTSVIGILIYLLVTIHVQAELQKTKESTSSRAQTTRICPTCKAVIPMTDKFCQNCGTAS